MYDTALNKQQTQKPCTLCMLSLMPPNGQQHTWNQIISFSETGTLVSLVSFHAFDVLEIITISTAQSMPIGLHKKILKPNYLHDIQFY